MNKMVVSVGVGLNFSYNKKKMNTNRGSISSRYPLVRPTKKNSRFWNLETKKLNLKILIPRVCFAEAEESSRYHFYPR